MYADDTTAFIRGTLFDLLDQFGDLSGLKIYKSKTEGLWLGVWKCRLGKDEPFGISLPKQYVTALGIAFPYNVRAGNKINFDERLAKLKNVLSIWSSRHLTILDRIAIVKNLALAKLVYSCSVLNVPVEFVKEANRNISSFIWNFNLDKVRRKTMVGPICKGGLNMVNFVDVVKSLNIAWVNRYYKATDSHWCALLDSMLSKVGGAFLFQCNYELKLLDLKNLPAFYKNVLAVWQELNSNDPIDVKEIQHEILWNNRFIRINGKSIYYKTWDNRGILKVCELLDTQGRFLCFEDFKCKFGARYNFLNYAGVLGAISKLLKSKIQGNNPMGSEPIKSLADSDTILSTKKACFILTEQSPPPPLPPHC